MPDLLVESEHHVATITLNRPDRLNAISGEMLTDLSKELIRCEQDRDIRVIVLTGAGRGFCAGLDLKDASSGSGSITGGSGGLPKIAESPPFVMRRLDTPVLCALNGPAAGYGMDLALGCDFLLASDQARFTPPVRRGVVPESGGTWLLPRLIGWQKACEVTLLARTLDAAEIERLGLANRVVPHDSLMQEARAWADELASNAPLAVAAAKRSMRVGLDSTFEANGHHVMAELMQLFGSEDFREGLAAFMEKREAKYQGR
jgi:enoyl-CoA hydratase/carnithine racemase